MANRRGSARVLEWKEFPDLSALITGAYSGIGFAVTSELKATSADVHGIAPTRGPACELGRRRYTPG